MILGEIRICWDRAQQRESRTLGDERCVIVGCANDDQARLAWNISDKPECAKHGLELRSPRARDDTQTIGAREQPTIKAVGTSAQIEDDRRVTADRLDDLDRAIDIQTPTQRCRAGQELNRRPARNERTLAARLHQRVRDRRSFDTRAEGKRWRPAVEVNEEWCTPARRGTVCDQARRGASTNATDQGPKRDATPRGECCGSGWPQRFDRIGLTGRFAHQCHRKVRDRARVEPRPYATHANAQRPIAASLAYVH